MKLLERREGTAVGLIVAGVVLILAASLASGGCREVGTSTPSPTPTVVPTATRTPEPLVPTVTRPTDRNEASSTGTIGPSPLRETSEARPRPGSATKAVSIGVRPTRGRTDDALATAQSTIAVELPRGRERFGAGVAAGPISAYPIEKVDLGLGWYLDWWVRKDPTRPAGADYWQMVQVSEDGYRPDERAIRAVATANPGSFWIIGNEPDVRWQNNTTPERYAEHYHELYELLKDADPSCHVVIGGVSQATPLRLAYLEEVLNTYRERYGKRMPVDVWNVHGFILREELGSWGVDVPPGSGAKEGELYDIDDHDDLKIFARQVRAFRRWMAQQGEREKPLVVSEYGILMPEDYGFGLERVEAFMEGSFDFLLTATDDEVGFPADGNRLAQWWCWYSLAAPEDYYPTGNLFDPATKRLTVLGEAFAAYDAP